MSEIDATPTTESEPDRAGGLYPQPSDPQQPTAEPDDRVTVEDAEKAANAVEDDAPAGDEPADDEPAKAAEPAKADESEGEPVTTLAELLETQEWDENWFNELKIPVKVDGKPAEATLKDIVASYQMGEAAERRLEEAKAERKAAADEIKAQHDQVNVQLAVAAKLMTAAEEALKTDMASVDMKALREQDPAEYAARKMEFDERREALENAKNQAVAEIQQAEKERQEQLNEEHKQFLADQSEKLIESIPEWRDPEKAKAEKSKLADYLIGQGFTREDVMGASDHRLILVARKAMLLDQMQSTNNAARKRVVKTPKVLKPGVKAEATQKAIPQDRASILYGE